MRGTWLTSWMLTLAVATIAPAADVTTVDADELRRLQADAPDGLLVIDVRPPHRFDARHLQGAINIPAFGLESKPLPSTASIVVYDDGLASGEAEKAAALLAGRGFTDVRVLDGGLTEWFAARHPVVAPTGKVLTLIEPIAATQLERLLDGSRPVTVIDLRPAAAWREGHVPGARSVADVRALTTAAGDPKSTELVVVYDDGSGEAEKQAEQLRRRGFRAVRYLYGGMPAWKQAELRIEK